MNDEKDHWDRKTYPNDPDFKHSFILIFPCSDPIPCNALLYTLFFSVFSRHTQKTRIITTALQQGRHSLCRNSRPQRMVKYTMKRMEGRAIEIRSGTGHFSVKIYDISGKLIYNDTSLESRVRLPVHEPGVYLVKSKNRVYKVCIK